MAITPAVFLQLTDKMAARYLSLVGDAGTSEGLGSGNTILTSDWGFSRKSREYVNLIIGSADPTVILPTLQTAQKVALGASMTYTGKALLYPDMKAFDQVCAASGLLGVSGMATFASYYNTGTGGPYNALLNPTFATVFSLIYSGAAASLLASSNIYSPAVANMGQQAVGGAFVPGTIIDNTVYAGAALSSIVVTGGTWTAPVAITVTGSGRNSAGSVIAGRTFSASAINANGTYALTPTTAGDLLLAVTAITLPAAMTAGTVVVTGSIPAGRVNPPT